MNMSKITLYDNCPYKNTELQIEKIKEELKEVIEAYENYLNGIDKRQNIGLETFDIIQSSFTLLKNMFTNEEIADFQLVHMLKMQRRYEK